MGTCTKDGSDVGCHTNTSVQTEHSPGANDFQRIISIITDSFQKKNATRYSVMPYVDTRIFRYSGFKYRYG